MQIITAAFPPCRLEPVRFEQDYRNRWDDQWDPFGSLPRG